MSLGRFRLSVVPTTLGMATGPSPPPSQLCLDLGIEPVNPGIAGPCNSQSVGVAELSDPGTPESLCDSPEHSETPATSKRKGSFNWDRENGWALKWASIAEFEAWLKDMEDIKSLSQELNDKIKNIAEEPDLALMEAVQSVRHTLTAALASTRGARALPNKENLPPNQNTWTETAERMGLKRPKRRIPDEIGLTNRSIGIAKGKRRRIYEDPYAGGERSGKHAKPDARVRLALPVPPAPPMLAPRALPPAGIPGPFPMPGPFPLAPPPALAPRALPLAGVPGLFPPAPLPALAPPALPFPPPPPPAPAYPTPAYPTPHPPTTLPSPLPAPTATPGAFIWRPPSGPPHVS
jgi:hypothetical protein